MDWLSEQLDIKIVHKLNNNGETRIGPYFPDGYHPDSRLVLFYNGCHWHGHNCHLARSLNSHERERRLNRTLDCEMYFKNEGYSVKSIWECEYFKVLSKNKSLQQFSRSRYPNFYQNHKGPVTFTQLMKSIKNDDLFGIVECDISVPESWGSIKPLTELPPLEYFQEMSPLFCTTEVPFSEIGDHMKNYAHNIGMSSKPRTLLIGGMKARNIMLSTPLLKWYLEHGLQVSRIHMAIESSQMTCFQDFVNYVTDVRRKGDIDETQKVISDTVKVVGNSAYGGVLLNKDKFVNVTYVEGSDTASKRINDIRFMRLTELDKDNEFYEIQ